MYSGKVIVFEQKFGIQAKWLSWTKLGCIRETGCNGAKVVVNLQSGCIWVKWFYSGNVVVFGQKWLYSGKVVSIGQQRQYLGKVVVFGQKWLYSGRNGCIREKVVVFGQNGCIRE